MNSAPLVVCFSLLLQGGSLNDVGFIPYLSAEYISNGSGEIWAAFNIEVLKVKEGETRRVWSSAGMEGQGIREILRKTRQPSTSSGTIPTCKNLGATLPGIDPGSHSLEFSLEWHLGHVHMRYTVLRVWWSRDLATQGRQMSVRPWCIWNWTLSLDVATSACTDSTEHRNVLSTVEGDVALTVLLGRQTNAALLVHQPRTTAR
ncbi:hypothetical protein PR048_000740 [Dryococelus australis]|uniref:Uncharacterized protein n=1 Tax=Dryococelus australis TaxID=614101 RepID=A0ABQ9IFG8_9NEOP|nr:hypothetical protein PR048_000740 [Dryococelus australis]